MTRIPPILQVGEVLLSSDILTEEFCCDLAACKGQCCVEGDAGAPVTLDEVGEIEERLDDVWPQLSAAAQAVIDRQGVAYTDQEGDLVTSIVGGKDCVFTCYEDLADRSSGATIRHCCLCALEKVLSAGEGSEESGKGSEGGGDGSEGGGGDDGEESVAFRKPMSCALYPIREKRFADGTTGLNYHRWDVCAPAVKKGRELHLPLYRFLRGPLVRRFGREWYQELEELARLLQV